MTQEGRKITDLEDEDAIRVKLLMKDFSDARKALTKAEKSLVTGGHDILMMLDGRSVADCMADAKAVLDRIEHLRTVKEPELMKALTEKYGPGTILPYTLQWASAENNNGAL